jgi:hypothetical protein
MLTLPTLLLLNALHSGLPLHAGATWTWEVTDHRIGSQILRTATAVDSTADDSGSVWTLSVKDSASDPGTKDTLRVAPDGTQKWVTYDRRKLNWILKPWDTASSKEWASILLNGYSPGWSTSVHEADAQYPAPYITTNRSIGMSSYWVEAGVTPILWDSLHGLMRLRVEQLSFPQNAHEIVSWRLLSHDGQSLSVPWDSLILPQEGSSWTWSEVTRKQTLTSDSKVIQSEDFDSCTLRWEIRTIESDSLDWARVQVSRRAVRDSGIDSSTFALRLNRRTGLRISANPVEFKGSTLLEPDETWWRRPSDSLLDHGLFRSSLWGTGSNGRSGTSINSSSNLLWLDSASNLALQRFDFSDRENDLIHQGTTIRTLTAINGVAASPTAIAIHPAPKSGKTGTSFTASARIHPNVSVRWRDAQGRGGMVPAATLLANATGIAPRIVFVEASFPDGSSWKGPVLTSGQLRH